MPRLASGSALSNGKLDGVPLERLEMPRHRLRLNAARLSAWLLASEERGVVGDHSHTHTAAAMMTA